MSINHHESTQLHTSMLSKKPVPIFNIHGQLLIFCNQVGTTSMQSENHEICILTSGPMSTQTPLKWILICILPHPTMVAHVQQLNSLIRWPYRFVKLEVPTIGTKTKVWKQQIHTHVINNEQGEPTASYRWNGWVWEITNWNSKAFQKLPTILENVRNIPRIYPNNLEDVSM